jgi:hypothetical protein
MSKKKFKGLFPYPANTFGRAFLLNSIAVSVATGIGIYTKNTLDKNKRYHNQEDKKIIITVVITFSAVMVSYIILYTLFGFGRGMMV